MTPERAPAVAGRFYSAEPEALAAEVARHLAGESMARPAWAVVAPHAGYVYSGATAGLAYRSVVVPSLVVVLGPNHTGEGARRSIYASGSWRLPGASVPIAEALADELARAAALEPDSVAHRREHSIEVQLPFLRACRADVGVVPICLARLPLAACRELGAALAAVVARWADDVLLVASTDMSHFLPAREAELRDRLALERLAALDPEGLYETVVEHDISMCGLVPTVVTLFACRALGARRAKLLGYTHSGAVSGDLGRVVGYAAAMVPRE